MGLQDFLPELSFTLVAADPSSDLFSPVGTPSREKIIILGSSNFLSENNMNRVRSLHIEHVSPATLMRQEISRHSKLSFKAEEVTLAAFRRWFWTRKPDAGFLLKDFPATLLQALVFDEWLEARSEALNAVLVAPDAPAELIDYYRNHGLLSEAT